MEAGNGTSEYKSIAAQFAAAKKQKVEVAPDNGEQKTAARFKSLHLAAVIFFSWILCVRLIHLLEVH